jgi:hypothetical protein
MSQDKNYYSDRGMQLLYVGQTCGVPILTLENYMKWYNMFLVNPDGSVELVSINVIQEAMERDPLAIQSDHSYHPRLLFRIAELLKAEVDERAIEVAAGRWMIEHVGHREFLDPEWLAG